MVIQDLRRWHHHPALSTVEAENASLPLQFVGLEVKAPFLYSFCLPLRSGGLGGVIIMSELSSDRAFCYDTAMA